MTASLSCYPSVCMRCTSVRYGIFSSRTNGHDCVEFRTTVTTSQARWRRSRGVACRRVISGSGDSIWSCGHVRYCKLVVYSVGSLGMIDHLRRDVEGAAWLPVCQCFKWRSLSRLVCRRFGGANRTLGMPIPRGPTTPEEARGMSWSSLTSRRSLGDFNVHRRNNSKGEPRLPPLDGDHSDASDDIVGQLDDRQIVRSVRSTMSIEQLAAWWETEAKKKEEEANRKEEEASRKEEEARRLEEKAQQSLEEARRLEAWARQAEASAKVREAAAQSKEAEAKKREAAAQKREAEAQRKEEVKENAVRLAQQGAARQPLESSRLDTKARRKEDDVRKREEEVRRKEGDARKRKDDGHQNNNSGHYGGDGGGATYVGTPQGRPPASSTHTYRSSSSSNPLPPPPQERRDPGFSLPPPQPAKPSGGYRHAVRYGFWNRRGDYLTMDKYVVYAPYNRANPPELEGYPAPTEGYKDHYCNFVKYDPSLTELPESLPRQGLPPVLSYEKFVTYVYR